MAAWGEITSGAVGGRKEKPLLGSWFQEVCKHSGPAPSPRAWLSAVSPPCMIPSSLPCSVYGFAVILKWKCVFLLRQL